MQTKNRFKLSLVATALTLGLTACGGDINLSSNVDNSIGDTIIENPAPTPGPDPVAPDLPGKPSTALSNDISSSVGLCASANTRWQSN
jgi:hypothetical protein